MLLSREERNGHRPLQGGVVGKDKENERRDWKGEWLRSGKEQDQSPSYRVLRATKMLHAKSWRTPNKEAAG